MAEIPSTTSERGPQGPRRVLLVQAKDSLFQAILGQVRSASRRETFITPTPPSEIDREVGWALQRGQPFDLVVIEIMDKNEIERSFKLAARIKQKSTNNPFPFIALALTEIEWVRKVYSNEQVAKEGVDYITDRLRDQQSLRSLFLFAEEWS